MSASAEHVSSRPRERGAQDEPTSVAGTETTRPLDRLWTTLAVAGIALLAIRRWSLLGPYPPGLDGAQWLALGRGLDGQSIGRSTEGAYAPLVPVLALITESIAGPLFAVRLLAEASGLAVSLAIWFVARGALGSIWGLMVAAVVIPASALAEPVLFGGYPQQFALAAGIVALWAVCRFLVDSSGASEVPPYPSPVVATQASPAPTVRDAQDGQVHLPWQRAVGQYRNLMVAGIAALITAAAHHVYFPVFALAVLAAIGLWLANRPPLSGPARIVGSLVVALTPALVLFAAVAFVIVRAGYAAPLDASARSFVDAWRYGTRESPEMWTAFLAVGLVGIALHRRTRGDPAPLLAASLLASAGILFLLSGQPRLLPPILIGAGIAAGLCARSVASIGPRARSAVILLALVVAATLLVPADRATSRFADFYRVVDGSLVRAAAAIESAVDSGAVAVREDRRGWPVGWWFDALLNRPVIVGSDPQWLAFPAEQEHALQAEALFDGGLDAETFRRRAIAAGVRFLVVPKWDWIGWERWLTTPGFPVTAIYDDDRYLVLRVT